MQELLEGRELRAPSSDPARRSRGLRPWRCSARWSGPRRRAPAGHRPPRREAREHLPLARGATRRCRSSSISASRASSTATARCTSRAPARCSGRPTMAPGQPAASRDLDARVDVWAMGVVFREALTGERPLPRRQLQRADDRDPVGAAPRSRGSAGAAAARRRRARPRSPATATRASATPAGRARRARASPDAFAQTAPGVSSPGLRTRVRRARRLRGGAAAIAAVAFTWAQAPARQALPSANLATPAVLRAPTTPPRADARRVSRADACDHPAVTQPPPDRRPLRFVAARLRRTLRRAVAPTGRRSRRRRRRPRRRDHARPATADGRTATWRGWGGSCGPLPS